MSDALYAADGTATHQDTTNKRDLERCGNYAEDDGLKEEGYSPTEWSSCISYNDAVAIDAYFVPLSIARVSPPVCRDRWNLRSRWRRCSNVCLATLRTALWPTLAKVALRSSPDNVAPIRAAPSTRHQRMRMRNVIDMPGVSQPRIRDPPTIQTVEPAVMSTLSVSMICLNISGTCTFNS